jgi:hypothetical protein
VGRRIGSLSFGYQVRLWLAMEKVSRDTRAVDLAYGGSQDACQLVTQQQEQADLSSKDGHGNSYGSHETDDADALVLLA